MEVRAPFLRAERSRHHGTGTEGFGTIRTGSCDSGRAAGRMRGCRLHVTAAVIRGRSCVEAGRVWRLRTSRGYGEAVQGTLPIRRSPGSTRAALPASLGVDRAALPPCGPERNSLPGRARTGRRMLLTRYREGARNFPDRADTPVSEWPASGSGVWAACVCAGGGH